MLFKVLNKGLNAKPNYPGAVAPNFLGGGIKPLN